MVRVDGFDHIVLTVRDIRATCDFYSTVLGMRPVLFDGDHWALEFGQQKINLHQMGHEFEPKALRPSPGSADLCFITAAPMERILVHLKACQVDVIEGPGFQVGATGGLRSVYFRDPDGNLVELSNHHMPKLISRVV